MGGDLEHKSFLDVGYRNLIGGSYSLKININIAGLYEKVILIIHKSYIDFVFIVFVYCS